MKDKNLLKQILTQIFFLSTIFICATLLKLESFLIKNRLVQLIFVFQILIIRMNEFATLGNFATDKSISKIQTQRTS